MPRPEAVRCGLQHLSYRTLVRLSGLAGNSLLLACADGRWTRRRGGHRSITKEVREAIFAVKAECGPRARLSQAAKHRLMHQYMSERFPTFPTEKIPSRWTLAAVWKQWFGPGGSRQRYRRTAEAAAEAGVSGRMVVHRPGQVLVLDSTPMPVKLRETVFGNAITATLPLALDLYTHRLPAFRLTLQSDTSVDIAMLLRDVMLPLPMRDGWGEDMEWPYAGVPAEVIAEFTGHRVAALPFFAPETVTTDHGGPYKNHDLVEAETEIGCRILPAGVLRQTDKFAVERQFLTIQTMLFEHLLGFTGGDVADRGAGPERDASLTLAQAEHIIATWIVQIRQNRKPGEYAPSWAPGEDHSPNTLFAAAMEQGGFDLDFPEPSFYYKVLRKHHVKIHPRRTRHSAPGGSRVPRNPRSIAARCSPSRLIGFRPGDVACTAAVSFPVFAPCCQRPNAVNPPRLFAGTGGFDDGEHLRSATLLSHHPTPCHDYARDEAAQGALPWAAVRTEDRDDAWRVIRRRPAAGPVRLPGRPWPRRRPSGR